MKYGSLILATLLVAADASTAEHKRRVPKTRRASVSKNERTRLTNKLNKLREKRNLEQFTFGPDDGVIANYASGGSSDGHKPSSQKTDHPTFYPTLEPSIETADPTGHPTLMPTDDWKGDDHGDEWKGDGGDDHGDDWNGDGGDDGDSWGSDGHNKKPSLSPTLSPTESPTWKDDEWGKDGWEDDGHETSDPTASPSWKGDGGWEKDGWEDDGHETSDPTASPSWKGDDWSSDGWQNDGYHHVCKTYQQCKDQYDRMDKYSNFYEMGPTCGCYAKNDKMFWGGKCTSVDEYYNLGGAARTRIKCKIDDNKGDWDKDGWEDDGHEDTADPTASPSWKGDGGWDKDGWDDDGHGSSDKGNPGWKVKSGDVVEQDASNDWRNDGYTWSKVDKLNCAEKITDSDGYCYQICRYVTHYYNGFGEEDHSKKEKGVKFEKECD